MPNDDELSLRRAIAIGAPDASCPNTIVLGGASVVIPLEMNLEEDPLHDDEVRLVSARGSYDRTLYVSDPEVEPDRESRLMHYHFADVPFGVYRVEVCTAGVWHHLMHGLVVAQDGVFHGGKKLTEEKPSVQVAEPEVVVDDDDAAEDEDEELSVYFHHGAND